jgi:hypothetical protein
MQNKWYQFKLTINHQAPIESEIIFPDNPQLHPPAGEQIHLFLIQSGMVVKPSEQEKGEYLYQALKTVNLSNLVNLQRKFAHQGATLQELGKEEIAFPDWITKEEFEEFKAETKKLLLLKEEELSYLEQQLTEN